MERKSNKKKSMLYISYASSDYYARETGISLIGFFENNPDYDPEEVFILDYGILENNKNKLNGIAAYYGKRIEYLPAKEILEEIQKSLDLKDFRGSLATYSRAFIDKIMPEHVQRLLYIDSDTVVVGSVSGLKYFDMGDACMAGVEMEELSTQVKNKKLHLYSGNRRYFGCGVVLFDLDNWRNKNCYSKICETLRIKKEYPCADQTLINNSLPESYFCKLSRKYNYVAHIFSSSMGRALMLRGGCNTEDEVEDVIANPVVIHYPGRPIDRPWYQGCTSRLKEPYFRYKQLSPWKEDELYVIPEPISFRQKYYRFLHTLETKESAFTLLMIINHIRRVFGNCLRAIGLVKPLPSEGVE